MQKIRWGILGTGSIAQKFALGLSFLEDAELRAVGSRAQQTADAFAEKWDIPHRHASYAALAQDPDVDVVYVATPHPMHKGNSILCMRAGKAVLCEKPLTINARQAEEVIACAQERGVFLMEAMWTRFLPAICRLRELLADGALGEVRMLKADFCFRSGWEPEARLFNPELAGGGLLDVGIYPLALASMVFGGPPAGVTGMAHIGETGVDEQAAMLLRYDGGRLAVLTCGIRAAMPHEAYVIGTERWIRIHSPFWKTTGLTLGVIDRDEEVIELPYEGNGYECEAAEVHRCLRAGKLESDIMPLEESLSIVRTMDELRAQWALTYPME
ncbi:MAG: Gfo/Idh/MocA family oxidoreductase [Candidatus Brocadiae bacterium]|nr:Gfo/Idh/MocA family oxidoreductase [Candidatus Brocadiia bacterium]